MGQRVKRFLGEKVLYFIPLGVEPCSIYGRTGGDYVSRSVRSFPQKKKIFKSASLFTFSPDCQLSLAPSFLLSSPKFEHRNPE